MINAPSLANCSLLELGRQVEELVAAGIDHFHLDLMDGRYVPNLGLPLTVVSDLKHAYPTVVADVHLMVEQPHEYVSRLAEAGADAISFAADSTRFIIRTARKIRAFEVQAGVAINPSQPVEIVAPYLTEVDRVILMAVEPGVHGQLALPGTLDRLKDLVRIRNDCSPTVLIEIDGGVDAKLGRACIDLGADILVTGNLAVFRQPEGIEAAVKRFQRMVVGTHPEEGHPSI